MDEFIVVGEGGHARVIIDILTAQGVKRENIAQVSDIITKEDIFNSVIVNGSHVVVAIGDNAKREAIAHLINETYPAVIFDSVIHPDAVVSKMAIIGPGSVVCAGSIVGPSAIVKSHAIVNTAAVVDHDCVIGDFASIGPGALLAGGVVVESRAIVGIGGTILQGRYIGESALIGANSLVVSNVPENTVVYGTPAKFVRLRKQDDPYLD